jgi:uncharacterized protein
MKVDVIVFARRPRPGRVKRRLARSVGRRHAAWLYAQTLERAVAAVEGVRGVSRILMSADPRDRAWFGAQLSRRGWRVRPQVAGNIGRRMAAALETSVRRDRAALLIGSDVMDCVASDLRHAIAHLAGGYDLVLGPAADGGYWLIGIVGRLPEVFEAVPWSTAGVLAATLAATAQHGSRVALLGARHDLDRAQDRFGQGGAFYRRRTRWRSSSAT